MLAEAAPEAAAVEAGGGGAVSANRKSWPNFFRSEFWSSRVLPESQSSFMSVITFFFQMNQLWKRTSQDTYRQTVCAALWGRGPSAAAAVVAAAVVVVVEGGVEGRGSWRRRRRASRGRPLCVRRRWTGGRPTVVAVVVAAGGGVAAAGGGAVVVVAVVATTSCCCSWPSPATSAGRSRTDRLRPSHRGPASPGMAGAAIRPASAEKKNSKNEISHQVKEAE